MIRSDHPKTSEQKSAQKQDPKRQKKDVDADKEEKRGKFVTSEQQKGD